jgi:hypothetical protein
MAVFLVRTLHPGEVLPTCAGVFEDVPCSDPFAPFIEQLVADGITAGCHAEPRLYCPTNPITRGQMAVFLTKAFELPLP